MTQIDTDTAARALGCAPRTARDLLARIAARTGREGRSRTAGRPGRTVPLADLAAHLGLAERDVLDAAALAL